MNVTRFILRFGRLELVVIVTDNCRTIATWWLDDGEHFLARCQGGRA